MPSQDRKFRPVSDGAYIKAIRERRETGVFGTASGRDPVAVMLEAQIKLTNAAAVHEQRKVGRPAVRELLARLLKFVVENGYRLGWEMAEEKRRLGRPVKDDEIAALFPTQPTWMVGETGVPRRVGTGAHIKGDAPYIEQGLVEAAAKKLNVSVTRAGDLARQLADMAGQTPEGMIGKNLPTAN